MKRLIKKAAEFCPDCASLVINDSCTNKNCPNYKAKTKPKFIKKKSPPSKYDEKYDDIEENISFPPTPDVSRFDDNDPEVQFVVFKFKLKSGVQYDVYSGAGNFSRHRNATIDQQAGNSSWIQYSFNSIYSNLVNSNFNSGSGRISEGLKFLQDFQHGKVDFIPSVFRYTDDPKKGGVLI